MYLFLIFVIYYYLETTLDVGTHNKKGECKMDISTIKEEIASLEAKEKEIIEFLEKNADRITVIPEFNSKYGSQRYVASGVVMGRNCNCKCSECKSFVIFVPSYYTPIQLPFQNGYNPTPSFIGSSHPYNPPVYIPPSQCVISGFAWCLKQNQECEITKHDADDDYILVDDPSKLLELVSFSYHIDISVYAQSILDYAKRKSIKLYYNKSFDATKDTQFKMSDYPTHPAGEDIITSFYGIINLLRQLAKNNYDIVTAGELKKVINILGCGE